VCIALCGAAAGVAGAGGAPCAKIAEDAHSNAAPAAAIPIIPFISLPLSVRTVEFQTVCGDSNTRRGRVASGWPKCTTAVLSGHSSSI
jgi:hypothetical protein